ncbi:integumentary mucin C.1 [Astyanax mexicanus]|uniref:integumentary mucin C.1 n=1 Tax=Astyanax mexicanus TaxID=7994 RepID=UPI0020CAC292|nr:integumentary mucin C.1 [Astyanax mexicanus]
MTRMGSSPWSGGVLLFLILLISLPLIVMGQTSISSNSTTNMDDTATTAITTMISINSSTIFPVPGSNNTNMSMIYCRVFTCNVSQCYNTHLNTNATMCASPGMFCELRRDDPMRYSVNCVPVCRTSCNGSQINCSVSCCDSDICLNSTIANLTNLMPPMIPTTAPTTANTTTTTTTSPTTTTAANNGKKCNKVSCTGDICYQSNLATMLCPPTQHYCMLKKATSGTVMTWTAGCSEDCRKETACSATVTTCFLECCNATTTASCLKMTGVLNMPSSATRGLFSPMLLIISSLLFWLLSRVTSA